MIPGRLYKQSNDQVLRLCIDAPDGGYCVEQAHVAIGNIHFSPQQTLKRVERMGVYWPTMKKDVYDHVRRCKCMMGLEPKEVNNITLYQVTVAPKWAETIVQYLKTQTFPEDMNKVRQRYLQKQAQDYCLIAN